jgi:hypothetical protein
MTGKSFSFNLSTTGLVLASNAAIDFRLHTTYSDGTWMPEQLLDYLVQEQFGLAAILEKPSPQQPHELVALLKRHDCDTGELSAGKIVLEAGCTFLEKRKNYG